MFWGRCEVSIEIFWNCPIDSVIVWRKYVIYVFCKQISFLLIAACPGSWWRCVFTNGRVFRSWFCRRFDWSPDIIIISSKIGHIVKNEVFWASFSFFLSLVDSWLNNVLSSGLSLRCHFFRTFRFLVLCFNVKCYVVCARGGRGLSSCFLKDCGKFVYSYVYLFWGLEADI